MKQTLIQCGVNYSFDQEVESIVDDLIHEQDGPVTKFVVINRAMELAKNSGYDPYLLANALYQSLQTIGE